MSPIEWEDGLTNFKSFFVGLSEMSITSLQMTKEVLANRHQLEMKLKWMQGVIPQHLTQMEELQKKEEIVRMQNVAIDANQNFEIKVKVAKNVKDPINLYALSCKSCERTCQDHCNASTEIAHCEAFCAITEQCAAFPFWGWFALAAQHLVNATTDPLCKICKCVSSKHEKGQFRWICKDVEETQTLEEMRKKYEKAKGKKMDAEGLVTALKNDVEIQKKNIVESIDIIKEINNCLKRNALRGNPLTTPEYIRMMIDNEKNERKDGFAIRIKSLEELLPLAKMTKDIVENATEFLKDKLRV
jgi:hypothetical protein